ncbi:MAG: LamG domain-containing protein [Gammaproteobacteria bacterium]
MAVVPHRRAVETVSTRHCYAQSKAVSDNRVNAYDRQVLTFNPVMFLTLGNLASGTYHDLSGNRNVGTFMPMAGRPGIARLPNGSLGAQFDGSGQYVQIRSVPSLSITDTGCLTVEAWVRPAVLQFPHEEGSGYAYILGKGEPGRQEYALRMYSFRNSEVPDRPNRISAYVFNSAGGEGSGSYFQDPIVLGQWIMVTFVVDDIPSPSYPDGSIAIYKNNRLRGCVSLDQFHVIPERGNSPLRIATRNLDSYFEGAVGDVAVYDSALSSAQVGVTYRAMFAFGG